ncbi:MAG: hypothetical protein IH840_06200 [Candidatus Heimdallarchaeota archaeon]|nr:hypothetical protein [Candidatus Heimdallarchaeota archaeon]
MSKNKLSIRVDLDQEFTQMLDEVKQSRALKSNADAIRHCLYELTRVHNIQLNELQLEKIKQLLKIKSVKVDYSIYSVIDFVNYALSTIIDQIRAKLPSIQDWDVRADLNEEETRIALALIECQNEALAGEVLVDDIAAKLKLRNDARIREILDGFADRGILSTRTSSKGTVYHARKDF